MKRPRGIPVLAQARHGAWVLEVHYHGSAIRDVFEMFTDEAKAREALEFLHLVYADDLLFALQGEGEDIARAHFKAGWLRTDTEDGW